MAYPLSLPVNEPIVTLTNPKEGLWVIELHNGQDSRLTHTLINHGLMPALNAVEKHWRKNWGAAQNTKGKDGGKGALIIVGRRDQDKFFSNGLDFANSSKDRTFFPHTFNPLLIRLLTFPIPTIVAINGHCFAGAFIISLACDYRVMTDGSKRNAWLCMNEVHFGAVWPLSFGALVRAKFGDHRVQRKIALEGHRFTPPEALEWGILDYIVTGNTDAVLKKAEEVADTFGPNAKEGVWGLIKNDLYRDSLELMKRDLRMTNPIEDDVVVRSKL